MWVSTRFEGNRRLMFFLECDAERDGSFLDGNCSSTLRICSQALLTAEKFQCLFGPLSYMPSYATPKASCITYPNNAHRIPGFELAKSENEVSRSEDVDEPCREDIRSASRHAGLPSLVPTAASASALLESPKRSPILNHLN
jgi:hypothetical protein